MVERTIEKEDSGKGDLTPAARTELDELYQFGKACLTMGEKSILPVRIKVFHEMRDPMHTLVVVLKKEPTVNVCRSYTAQAANAMLQQGDKLGSLQRFMFFQRDEEPSYNVDDPLARRFTLEDPRMWKVVPTDEEEALALEVPGLLPSGAADKREYQIQRKFDELTKQFGATYLRWFAGEALYTLLENDMEGALEYCEIIQGMFLEGARLGQLVPRTNAIRAGLSIKVFADGYSSVPSLRPFNDESFDCFKRVFITRRDLEQSCFKTLANGARKNKSFEELFKEVSQKSSYEIENCQEIEDFIARVQQPDPKDDLPDLPARMPLYKSAIRNKTYAFFTNKYVELIGERAARLLHPSDMTGLNQNTVASSTTRKTLKLSRTIFLPMRIELPYHS